MALLLFESSKTNTREEQLLLPKARGPDPFGIRASEDRAGRVRLSESLTRMQRTAPVTQLQCEPERRRQGRGARTRRLHHRAAHERSRVRGGPVAGDDALGFHGDASKKRMCPLGRPVQTVKSLYSGVNPLRQCRLKSSRLAHNDYCECPCLPGWEPGGYGVPVTLTSLKTVIAVTPPPPRCRTCSGAESLRTSLSSKVSTCQNC